MLRFYVSTLIGTGAGDDPFRPAFADLALEGWGADDGRLDDTQAAGWMVCWVEATEAEHTAIAATAGVYEVPFRDPAGNYLAPDAPLADLDPALRTRLRDALEARQIPTDDLTLADPIRKVIARVVRRIRLRRALGADDFREALDTLLSAIPQRRRQRIAAALAARGFDTSVLVLTMTVREALEALAAQDVVWNRNAWDA